MKLLVCLAPFLLLCVPAWAINKCTGADGKVVFQDAACTGKGEKIEVKPAAGNLSPAEALKARAFATQGVIVGMTEKDVLRSWGNPTKVNRTVTASGVSEQWVYDRGNYQSQYIYLTNSVVTSMQSPQ